MNFQSTWSKPLDLIDGSRDGLTYTLANEDYKKLPNGPGAYVFARIHSERIVPLYIGETANIHLRITQHFKTNVKLMNGIKKAPKGKKVVIFCAINTKSESKRSSMLSLLQKALIEHSLAEGHVLLNMQLTKTPVHTISFKGNRYSEQIAPRTMYVQV
ncbi:MAG TPA: hypothetical protein VGM62_11340 [Chthoniobacterales bacterium]|jgi:hypothetical protein